MLHNRKCPIKKKTKSKRPLNSNKYKKFKQQVRERDGEACVWCQHEEKTTTDRTNIHHIKPWSSSEDHRYDPGNGCVLCSGHHTVVDQKPDQYEYFLKTLVHERNKNSS
jgi:hypothetical protein